MAPNNKVLKINFRNGSSIDLLLGKIVHSKSKKEMIYFDKGSDDRWRIIVSDKTMDNFNDIVNIELLGI